MLVSYITPLLRNILDKWIFSFVAVRKMDSYNDETTWSSNADRSWSYCSCKRPTIPVATIIAWNGNPLFWLRWLPVSDPLKEVRKSDWHFIWLLPASPKVPLKVPAKTTDNSAPLGQRSTTDTWQTKQRISRTGQRVPQGIHESDVAHLPVLV